MPSTSKQDRAHVGDWIEARGVPGRPGRRGQIIDILGAGAHEHYRVRWDERHESIVYPADGVSVVRRHAGSAGGQRPAP